MMLGVLQANRENVLSALHSMQGQLSKIESALSLGDFSKLEFILSSAQSQYQAFTS